MSGTCLLKTHVRNSEGNLVESKLFNDLLDYLPSRRSAVEYYAVGTDDRFLSKVKNKAKFDENGQITLNSLRQLAKIDLSDETIISKLDKELGSGRMSYA
jgi:hypothetical protein